MFQFAINYFELIQNHVLIIVEYNVLFILPWQWAIGHEFLFVTLTPQYIIFLKWQVLLRVPCVCPLFLFYSF